MKVLVSLCVLSLLAVGCGSAATKAAATVDAAPPREMGASPQAATRSAERVMWAVRTFDEKPSWLAAEKALASTEGAWGERMAAAVSRALDARRVESQVIPKDTTPAQLDALYAKGLQYLCEGTLSSIAAKDGTATLRVAYRLKRRVNEDTKTVQARVIEASLPSKALDASSVQSLIDATAEKIADAVVADVPADLLAIRG